MVVEKVVIISLHGGQRSLCHDRFSSFLVAFCTMSGHDRAVGGRLGPSPLAGNKSKTLQESENEQN